MITGEPIAGGTRRIAEGRRRKMVAADQRVRDQDRVNRGQSQPTRSRRLCSVQPAADLGRIAKTVVMGHNLPLAVQNNIKKFRPEARGAPVRMYPWLEWLVKCAQDITPSFPGARTFAPKPMEEERLRAEMIFSRPPKVPPHGDLSWSWRCRSYNERNDRTRWNDLSHVTRSN
jgi:hypothetical protein